jgi:Flp pilus assembly protein protease CpaA
MFYYEMMGIEKYYFLFALAFIWIVIACVQDLRRHEVDNWLNFSLIAFALAYRAFYSSYASDFMFFVYGALGFALFFGLANLFYYSGVFAGGDAKLLMGLGVVLPFFGFMDYAYVGFGFVMLLFFVGAIYSLIYSVFLVAGNYKKFASEFGKNIGTRKNWILASIFALVFVIFIYSLFGIDLLVMVFGVLFAVFVFFLLAYAKSLEVCMIKLISPSLLTEGDWLVKDIRLNKGIIKKTVHGLSLGDIVKLRRNGRKVLIKEGIPFTPAFLIAFVIMVFFLAVSGFEFSSLLAFLS